MSTKLDLVYVSLLAALGLACADRQGSEGETGEGSESGGSMTSATETGSSSGDGDGDPTTTTTTTTTGDGDGDPTTGDGDGDTTTTTGDGDGDPPEPFECLDPMPIMQAGTDMPSGFVECEGGFIHRAEVVECVNPQPEDNPSCADGFGCNTAADCIDGAYGSCQEGLFGDCYCNYGCVSDADCGEGEACVCAGVFSSVTQCVPAECLDASDCGEGLCGLSTYQGICEDSHSLGCANPTDECHVNDDCPEAPCDPRFPNLGEVPYHCTFSGEGFTCEAPGWCDGDCGRPFLVEGEARVADACTRRDWLRALRPAAVDADTAARLAEHWTRIGQFEHASVASFARFVSQLLALGAPPHLLRATQAAMADEVEHARLAFGLASAYAQRPLGPGPLSLERSLDALDDPRTIIEGLVHEACVGETLAALEANESAGNTRDPAVAEVLESIARDELGHAQLGWRCLAWLLETQTDQRMFALDCLDAAIERARGAALAHVREANEEDSVTSLASSGVLEPHHAARLRLAVLREVIEPCARRLRARYERDSIVIVTACALSRS